MRLLLCTVALLAAVASAVASPVLTTASFLNEMANLNRLAELPDVPYTARQFSSYDRASQIRGGAKVNWFANGDAGHYLRDETRNGQVEHVMMDADGPGVITRIWSANPDNTTIRFYIDGATEPTFEADFLALTTGKVSPFIAPLSHRLSGGANLYFPITFARHCKVTHTGNGIYYQIDARFYPQGTRIQSFDPKALPALRPAIERVASVLSNPDRLNPRPNHSARISLAPGQTAALLDVSGPAAIRYLAVRLSTEGQEAALRGTVLRIRFDGEKPQVECPLGDFFGTGPGANSYVSLPCTVTKDGELRCRFAMPFAKRATLTLTNTTSSPVRGSFAANVSPYRWSGRSLLFHAKWRADLDAPTRPFRDMRYISVDGTGRYVGTQLSITNPWTDWWGEGDEKIYVDGESFPSFFGTGTEDYFGYAWGSPQLYTNAYHAQTRCDGPGTFGDCSEVRWHLFDDIPFKTGVTFDLELWHWKDGRVPIYSRTSYYYARPGAADDHPPIAADELKVPQKPPQPLR